MCSVCIVLQVLPKLGFKMKGELCLVSFHLIVVRLARVVIGVM